MVVLQSYTPEFIQNVKKPLSFFLFFPTLFQFICACLSLFFKIAQENKSIKPKLAPIEQAQVHTLSLGIGSLVESAGSQVVDTPLNKNTIVKRHILSHLFLIDRFEAS